MIGISISRSVLALSSSLLFASAVNATTIDFLSDDFEQEGLGLNYTNFQNWTTTNGTVDSIGPNLAGLNCQSSNVCVDLDGSTRNSALFSTVDEFDIGSYLLSFDLSGSQRSGVNTVMVSLGDYSQSITMSSAEGWMTFQATVNVSQLSHLSFENQGGDNIGLLLDNVSVSRSAVVSPVPVPPTVFLLGSILGCLAVFRKKNLRKK